MNEDNALEIVAVVVWTIAAVLGVRSTFRVYRIYRAISPVLQPYGRMIGRSFVVVCCVITLAALYFGILAVWRLAGNDPVPWTPLVSAVVASAVLLLPPYLDRIVTRILRG